MLWTVKDGGAVIEEFTNFPDARWYAKSTMGRTLCIYNPWGHLRALYIDGQEDTSGLIRIHG